MNQGEDVDERRGDLYERDEGERIALGSTDRTVTIGADSSCQMRLTYSTYWTEREVPV